MVRTMKSCLQLSMKLVNSFLGIVGIAMVFYSLWLIRAWQRDSDDDHGTFPWFIHAFIGLGISFGAIACLGHVAADTANSLILSFYTVLLFLFLLLETGLLADVFLNSDWEKDFPKDPSGLFDNFREIVESNSNICKWIGLLTVLAQGICILLATFIRTLSTDLDTNSDSDDDSAPPLLYPLISGHPPTIVGHPSILVPCV